MTSKSYSSIVSGVATNSKTADVEVRKNDEATNGKVAYNNVIIILKRKKKKKMKVRTRVDKELIIVFFEDRIHSRPAILLV